MYILGVDPGIAHMGIGVLWTPDGSSAEVVHMQTVETESKAAKKNIRKSTDLRDRIEIHRLALSKVLNFYKGEIGCIVSEEPKGGQFLSQTLGLNVSFTIIVVLVAELDVPFITQTSSETRTQLGFTTKKGDSTSKDIIHEKVFSAINMVKQFDQDEHNKDAVALAYSIWNTDLVKAIRLSCSNLNKANPNRKYKLL